MCHAEVPLTSVKVLVGLMELEGYPGHLQLNVGHQKPRGGPLFPSLLSAGSSDPEAICLREVGVRFRPHHGPSLPPPHSPAQKEATDLDVVKGSFVGDIIEQ